MKTLSTAEPGPSFQTGAALAGTPSQQGRPTRFAGWFTKSRRLRMRLAALPVMWLATIGGGCRAPAPGTDPPEAPTATSLTPSVVPPPEPVHIPEELSDPDRWLVVEQVREGKRGAWATGEFDAARNKLTIKTHDVQQFSLDLSRVDINWKRLVVLGINGRNSELKKRNYSPIHLARDDHGRWVVLEP